MSINSSMIDEVQQARDFYSLGDTDSAISIIKLMGPQFRHLEKELSGNGGNLDYLNSYSGSASTTLSGIFSCSYHPSLSLEYSAFTYVDTTVEISDKFYNIHCTHQLESTTGLNCEQVVAIFPENFKNITPNAKHPVFYFINKFLMRHLKYTRPLLLNSQLREFFNPLLVLGRDRIENLISNWVNLHEVSHRSGIMPIPDYLFEKSNSFTAALEELRADVRSINVLLSSSKNPSSEERLTSLYILSERLCSYPLFRALNNFDTISSVFLWKFLLERNYLNSSSIWEGISEIEYFIKKMELFSLREKNNKCRRAKLCGLVKDFFEDYNAQYLNYKYFWGLL